MTVHDEEPKTKCLRIRLTADLKAKLEAKAKAAGRKPSYIARRALEAYVNRKVR